MNKESEIIRPEDSLAIISDVLTKTKEDISKHSFCFLLWGWIITSASVSFYMLQSLKVTTLFFLPFPVLVGIGIVITIAYFIRIESETKTYLSDFIGKLWMVLGLAFITTVFICLKLGYPPFTFTMLIGGIGTLVTGQVMKFKPMTIGGILFFIIAVGSAFARDADKPLLQALAVSCGYLIPGYILKFLNKEKTSNV